MDQEEPGQESSGQGTERAAEPARSRWMPKPEQILILESIFNSGMVNPTKNETVRIRKLLQKYGTVGDANVFYWFQNRRSRSRRRQRKIQAGHASEPNAAGAAVLQHLASNTAASGEYGHGVVVNTGSTGAKVVSATGGFAVPSPSQPSLYFAAASSSSTSGEYDPYSSVLSQAHQMGLPKIDHQRYPTVNSSVMWPCDDANLHYRSA